MSDAYVEYKIREAKRKEHNKKALIARLYDVINNTLLDCDDEIEWSELDFNTVLCLVQDHHDVTTADYIARLEAAMRR